MDLKEHAIEMIKIKVSFLNRNQATAMTSRQAQIVREQFNIDITIKDDICPFYLEPGYHFYITDDYNPDMMFHRKEI